MVTLSAAAFLLPLLLRRGASRVGVKQWKTLAYFFAIGFGYMILEIGTMKRLLLLLGHPVYAVTVTLLAFLVGSGTGCLLSARLSRNRTHLGAWLVVIALLGLAEAHLAPALLAPVMSYSAPVRFLAALVATLPLAFAMGIPFPAGASSLGENASDLLPWIWSVNGFASVSASLGALLFAMNFGYVVALDIGVFCYLLALVAVKGLKTDTAEAEG